MGLHISRIEVRNFRNFRHLVIGRFPARAVIVGENSVGKSNLLEAVRLVLDPSLPDTRRMLRDEDIWDGHPAGLSGGVEVSIVVELQGYDDDDDAKAVLSSCTVEVSPYTARLTYRFSPRAEIDPRDGAQLAQRPLIAQDYEFIVFGGANEGTDVRPIRRDVAVRVLPALRDAESDLQNWRRSPLRDLLERLPLDTGTLTATSDAISAAVEQLTKDPNVSKLQQHLSRRLAAMLGQRLAVEPTLGFASSQPDELIRSVRLFVDSARRRGVSEASLGSANVIYLGLLLEVLTQQREDDQFVATVVAVEEPEAHLHVSLQRHLFRYLLRSESSLVLTTHSPHIAAVAPINSFVVLRADENGTVGHSTGDLPITLEEAVDLERYIDVTRAEVLFASAVVLVEGLGELYILPALATAAGFDLDAYGVVVASVHGADFKPYRALLGPDGLDTPHVVITDGDAAPDRSGRKDAGLKRGADLLTDPRRGESLKERIKDLPDQRDTAYRSRRNAIARELRKLNVFVGAQTLETDLCAVFPQEMISAFEELSTSRVARGDVRLGVDNEAADAPNLEVRAAMMKRIGDLGKGRFAQRLAAHLEATDLRARVMEIADIDDPSELGSATLAKLGAASYLFLALNRISQEVRDAPLFPDTSQTTDNTGVEQADDDSGH